MDICVWVQGSVIQAPTFIHGQKIYICFAKDLLKWEGLWLLPQYYVLFYAVSFSSKNEVSYCCFKIFAHE